MPQSILLCVSHLRPWSPAARAWPELDVPGGFRSWRSFFFCSLLSSYREPTALFSCDGCVAVIPPDWAHLALAIGHLKIIHLTQAPAASSLSASIKAVPGVIDRWKWSILGKNWMSPEMVVHGSSKVVGVHHEPREERCARSLMDPARVHKLSY